MASNGIVPGAKAESTSVSLNRRSGNVNNLILGNVTPVRHGISFRRPDLSLSKWSTKLQFEGGHTDYIARTTRSVCQDPA